MIRSRCKYEWHLWPMLEMQMQLLRQVSSQLTGFVHNAVSPVGMATRELPLVLSHRIVELGGRGGAAGADLMWVGGGEPDLKLGMRVAAFVQAYAPIVCDCTYEGASTAATDG